MKGMIQNNSGEISLQIQESMDLAQTFPYVPQLSLDFQCEGIFFKIHCRSHSEIIFLKKCLSKRQLDNVPRLEKPKNIFWFTKDLSNADQIHKIDSPIRFNLGSAKFFVYNQFCIHKKSDSCYVSGHLKQRKAIYETLATLIPEKLLNKKILTFNLKSILNQDGSCSLIFLETGKSDEGFTEKKAVLGLGEHLIFSKNGKYFSKVAEFNTLCLGRGNAEGAFEIRELFFLGGEHSFLKSCPINEKVLERMMSGSLDISHNYMKTSYRGQFVEKFISEIVKSIPCYHIIKKSTEYLVKKISSSQ